MSSSLSGSTSSVDGLVSGLNTTQLIDQLMSLERQPQDQLVTKKSNDSTIVQAYQSINAKVASLQTAAQALTSASTWNAMKATSSNKDAVAVSATSSAIPSNFTFDVAQLATAHSVVSHLAVTSTAARVTTGATISITKGGADPVTITPVDGSLASGVSAINSPTAGVRAAAVQVSPVSTACSSRRAPPAMPAPSR